MTASIGVTTRTATAAPVRVTYDQLKAMLEEASDRMRDAIEKHVAKELEGRPWLEGEELELKQSSTRRRNEGRWYVVGMDRTIREFEGPVRELLDAVDFAATKYVRLSIGPSSGHRIDVVMDRSAKMQVTAVGADGWTRSVHEWATYRMQGFRPRWWWLTHWNRLLWLTGPPVAVAVLAAFVPAPVNTVLSSLALLASLTGLTLGLTAVTRASFLVVEPGGSPRLRQNVRDIGLLVAGAVAGAIVSRGLDALFPPTPPG